MKKFEYIAITLLFTAITFMSCVHTEKKEDIVLEKKHPTMRVLDRYLYTAYDEKVILRGINRLIIWVDKDGRPSFTEMAKTGANSARIVWLTVGTADQLDTVITNCIAEKMIPMIELHDATGKWDKLQYCVDYWTREDIVKVIEKHQEYLLVNIGNEIGDNSVSPDEFKRGYKEAVQRMRQAGIQAPLIIDGSDWGKNIDILQESGFYLIEADPLHNLMFSVHMWWPELWGYSKERVIDEIKESVDMHLPIIVGEFGNAWEETERGQIPYITIITECQKNEIGWLAWSWGPGNNPQKWLNMTKTGSFSTLFGWGLEVATTHTSSIKNTSKKPASLGGTVFPGPIPDEMAWQTNMSLKF
ncbi:MAG: cellulase family glycosylhydrolase [Spirochaetales bacterium]|nr:cellulase family glycosylhydrolase [Spirochaetales bacterium]